MYEFWFWESVREVRIYTRAMDLKGIVSGRSKVLVYSTIQSHKHFIGAKEMTLFNSILDTYIHI